MIRKFKQLFSNLPWQLKLLLQAVLVLGIAAAIWSRLVDGWTVASAQLNILHPAFIASILLFVVAVASTGIAWGRMTNKIRAGRGKEIDPRTAVKVQIMSWLLKYIPGQVGSFGSKFVWGESAGYSKKTILMSVAYENIFLASASLILSLPLVGGSLLSDAQTSILIPFGIAAAVAVLLIPGLLKSVVNLGLKTMNKKVADEQHSLNSKDTIITQFWFLVPRLINALGFVLIVGMFASFDLIVASQLGAAYILAGIIGIMAFFVPSGLGVREAVIILVATPLVGAPVAAASAIIARLAATIADVVLAGIYGMIRAYGKS